MGIFERLFGKSQSGLEASQQSFEVTPDLQHQQQYVSPEPAAVAPSTKSAPQIEVIATEPWAKKLASYAGRVSRELKQSGVETWPQEDFWVIAADVYEATWHVPVTNSLALQRGWMREGQCNGKALLLRKDGKPFQAEFVGHFNFDDRHLEFTYEHSNVDLWRTSAWGANNFASWRDRPGSYGRVPQAQRQEFWDGRWNYRGVDEKPPGLGTSLAL